MPVEEHETHSSTKRDDAHRYGCHNKPRPSWLGWVAHSKAYGGGHSFRMSSECRYDHSLKDHRCDGCRNIGSGEEYARKVRMNGK